MCLSTTERIKHQAYQPSMRLTIKPIDSWSSFATHKPIGLLDCDVEGEINVDADRNNTCNLSEGFRSQCSIVFSLAISKVVYHNYYALLNLTYLTIYPSTIITNPHKITQLRTN